MQRKPLILRGARQGGKTYLLKEFAKKEYPDHVYLNFDEEPSLASFFQENLAPERILKELNIYFKEIIEPPKAPAVPSITTPNLAPNLI